MVNGAQQLPDGWKIQSLNDVVGDGLFVDGDWVESKDQDPNGDVRLIQLADIGDGYFRNRSDRYLTNKKAKELGCTFLENGDLLVARMPDPLGRACVFPGDKKKSVTVVDVCVIRTENVNHRWLMHAINSPQFRADVESLQSGSTRKRISRKNLEKVELAVPPLPEQERIVAKIEELFTQLEAGTSALERVQAGLRRYKASVLKAAVEGKLGIQKDEFRSGEGELPEGWRWTTVEELAADERYSLAIGPFGSNLKVVDYRTEGVPLVFVRHIRMANFDNTHYVTKEKAVELKAHQIVGGDVLITKMGEPPGDACLYPETKPPAVITADCIKWRVAEDLAEKRFIVHMINSPVMQKQIQKITRGVAQKKVSLDRFRGLSVPLPPLEEQRRIVAEVERRLSVAREVESVVEKALARSARLRQAVLKSAFEGRLG